MGPNLDTPMQHKRREFWERGKPPPPEPMAGAPTYSYLTKKLWRDLNDRLRKFAFPYDVTFTLTDVDVTVTARVVMTDVGGYKSWSINRQQFIRDDCAARAYEIVDQLEAALQKRGKP